jgi:hypothetical protein
MHMEAVSPIAHTVDRAVEVSKISRSRIYEFMKSGVLPYSEVGGRRLILDEDLRALIRRHRVVVQAA